MKQPLPFFGAPFNNCFFGGPILPSPAGTGTRASSVLVCPILSRRSGEVLGMVEVINKKTLGSKLGAGGGGTLLGGSSQLPSRSLT